MQAIGAASPTMGTAAACDALGVPRASVYRRRQPARPRAARAAPPRALDARERQTVLATLHSERFIDQAPAQVHATLLDEGTYLCAPRTMYRLLDAAGEVKERRLRAWIGICHEECGIRAEGRAHRPFAL